MRSLHLVALKFVTKNEAGDRAGHVLVQQSCSEIVFLTKFQESHKRCVSGILGPFPNIIIIKVNSLSILEMNVHLKDRRKTLMDKESTCKETVAKVEKSMRKNRRVSLDDLYV